MTTPSIECSSCKGVSRVRVVGELTELVDEGLQLDESEEHLDVLNVPFDWLFREGFVELIEVHD